MADMSAVDVIEKVQSTSNIQEFEIYDSKEKSKKNSLLSKIKSFSIDSKNDETLLFPGYAPIAFKYFSQKSLPRYWFLNIITRPWYNQNLFWFFL